MWTLFVDAQTTSFYNKHKRRYVLIIFFFQLNFISIDEIVVLYIFF